MSEPQVDFDSPDQNQLAVIVQESNLPQSKAKYILERFQDYFTMADEWTKTTQQIKVTDASQTHLMDMARAARLAIREKRLAVEKAHKEIKADVLREGRAIDGIKNVLISLLEPLEVYYDKQENFVKYQEAEKAELIRLEVEKRIEEEIAEAARAKEIEDQRIREENERLKEQAYQKEQELVAERKANEAKIEAERKRVAYEQERKDMIARAEQEQKIADIQRANKLKADQDRKEQEEKLAKERAEREKVEKELRDKKEVEAKAERERVAKEEALKVADDSQKMLKLMEDIQSIKTPINLTSKKAKYALGEVEGLLQEAIHTISLIVKEEEVDF